MKQFFLYILMAFALSFGGASDANAIFNKVKSPDYYDINVRDHFKKNEWSQGKKLLDEAWDDYGTMSIMNELMGWYYLHFKKYDKARFYLIRSLRDDESNTHSREMIEKVEEETGNYSSAICYINELLDRNPYSKGLWRRKIALYRRTGNDEEANRLLKRLRQIYPNDEDVKKDIAYLSEIRLAEQKSRNNIVGMVESLQEIVKAYPNNPEYYMQLTNVLLQSGRTSEALATSRHGAMATKSPQLMKKHAGILSEQGNYVEAINYLKECERTYGASLQADINATERAAAETSQLNDPYTSMARLYAKQNDGEALQYLLNTSIARCYYNDALEYLRAMKKSKGETEDLLYKEYVVQRGLGDKKAAYNALNKIFNKNHGNQEVADNLSLMRYESASEQMKFGEYNSAIVDLLFVLGYSNDKEVKQSAAHRLFNCYRETKQYDEAILQLDNMKRNFAYEDYYSQKAAILNEQGQTEQALHLLEKAIQEEKDAAKAKKLAYQYEEYAIPYIKGMIQKGMIRQADKSVREALLVCPSSNALLHYGITTSDMLGKTNSYNDYVIAGRSIYPEDPFFIVKEASLLTKKGEYEKSIALLRPQLDVYSGDSTLVGAFAENSQALALYLTKKKAYREAISTLDSALVFNIGNRELLYTKGLIYEKMHQYDSAYVYQKFYQPTLMDYREHSRHLEEILNRGLNNELTLMYQYARPGDEDVMSANAGATYTHKNVYNDITGSINYAGRDGIAGSNLGKEMESGGTGVQLGLEWNHRFHNDSRWSCMLGASWASKYFPQIMAKAGVGCDVGRDWNLGLHVSYRRLHAYSRNYEWQPNPEYDPNNPDSDPEIYIPTTWEHHYRNLFQAGLTAEKTIDKFLLQGGVDVFLLMRKLYINGQVKMQFFPIEGSKAHLFATGGVGNAPQTELLDNSMPAGFSKINTFVGGGLLWPLNRYLAGAVSGTWYTMYRSQNTYAGIWDPKTPVITSSEATDYKNMFYLQLSAIISF